MNTKWKRIDIVRKLSHKKRLLNFVTKPKCGLILHEKVFLSHEIRLMPHESRLTPYDN
jgi:hypothetical protein